MDFHEFFLVFFFNYFFLFINSIFLAKLEGEDVAIKQTTFTGLEENYIFKSNIREIFIMINCKHSNIATLTAVYFHPNPQK